MSVHSSKFKVGIVHARTSGWIIIHRHTVDTITYFFVTQYIIWAEKALTNTFHLHYEGFLCTFSELIIFVENDSSNLL